ncbi:MAG: HIT domain-containing protein [Theionarchaea archaeon]|nr:HIT domain-containing protein [Theionarchaea archaeon]
MELLGNTVPHLHWHVIPRRKTGPLKLQWPIWGKDYAEVTVSEGECRQIAEKIQEHL